LGRNKEGSNGKSKNILTLQSNKLWKPNIIQRIPKNNITTTKRIIWKRYKECKRRINKKRTIQNVKKNNKLQRIKPSKRKYCLIQFQITK
jgi:hypothetical protein